MTPWSSDGSFVVPLSRGMARLARMPAATAWIGGMASLLAVLLIDGGTRTWGLRLVPLYVPVLCVTCWALGRGSALLFAAIAGLIALLPDALAAADPFGPAIATNTIVRAACYIFLALIIAAYRRAYDEADFRSMYDGLTGTLAKLPFQTAMVRHLAAARRARQTLIVACVDMDGFKDINAAYGYSAGDIALRAFSREAMSAIRGSDLVGRLGGDEFGFLVGTSSGGSAEALVHVLHQRLTTALDKTGLPLSCSMGALIVPAVSELTETALIDRAGALMRQAKAVGRGAVLTEAIEERAQAA
jgi:diguanylate cyclase (GGDEF)-like protein